MIYLFAGISVGLFTDYSKQCSEAKYSYKSESQPCSNVSQHLTVFVNGTYGATSDGCD